jgi:hypothetical protein
MKQITFSASVISSCTGDKISIDTIQRHLAQLGDVTILESNEIMNVKSEGLGKVVWIQFEPGENPAYYYSTESLGMSIDLVSKADLKYLRSVGVCVEISGEYPRSSEGRPRNEDGEDDVGERLIAKHQFGVDLEALTVNWGDDDDDCLEPYWVMKILLPADAPMGFSV